MLSNINKAWVSLITFFLMIIVVIPTGNFYGINIKIVVSIMLIFFISIRLNLYNIPLKYITSLLIYIFFLTFYAALAIFNGFDINTVLSAANIYGATFLVPWLLMLAIRIRCITTSDLTNIYLCSAGVFCLLKMILYISIMLNIIELPLFLAWMEDFFGYSPITYDYGWIVRINMPADYILLPGLVLAINLKNLRVKGVFTTVPLARVILILLMLFSAFLTMSRFYIVYLIITIFVSYIIYLKLYSSKKMIAFLLFTMFLVCINMFIFRELIFNFIVERFSGDNAAQSDSVRLYLTPLFYDLISNSPLVGHGLGSYIIEYPYYDDMPWNYVLLWLSTVQQFGVVGLVVVFIFITIPIMDLIRAIFHIDSMLIAFGLILLYLIWLSSGLFSSYLLSSQAGVSFVGYYLLSSLFGKMNLNGSMK